MMKKDGVWYTGGHIAITDPEQIATLDRELAESRDAFRQKIDQGEQVREQASEQEPPAPEGESKADAFKRLAKARMTKSLKAIELLGNLSSRSSYDYTDAQIAKMRDALVGQMAATFSRFEKKDKDKPLFDFDE